MNIKEKYLDFFKSNEIEKTYQIDKYNRGKLHDFILQKKQLKNPNLIAMYYTQKESQDDPFTPLISKYLCTYDKNTLEILHLSSDLYDCLDKVLDNSDYDEVSKLQRLPSKIIREIENLLLSILNNNKEIYLKSINFKDFEKTIIEMYKDKRTEPIPSDMVSFKLNFDNISDYFEDKKKFIYKQAKLNLTEENIEKYKRYLALTVGYREYVDKIENSDIGKIKKILLDIMSNEKYKNIKIDYTLPDGTKRTHEYGKEGYGFYRIKSDIFDLEKIVDIPIKSIDMVRWSRSTLYKRDDIVSPSFDYSEKEKINDFIKQRHMYHYPKYVYSDKNYIEAIYEKCGASILQQIDKDLLSDKTYIEGIINKKPNDIKQILSNLTGSKLFSDKSFIEFIFSKIFTNEKRAYDLTENIRILLDRIDPVLLTDLNLVKELFKNNPSYSTDFFNKFDSSIINNPEIISLIESEKFGKGNTPRLFFKYFDTSEKLLNVFSKQQLQESISYIDDRLLISDKALVMTLLDDMPNTSVLFANSENYFLNSYAEDETVMEKVCQIVSGRNSIQKTAAILKINPQFDKEKIYELASNNIEFLDILSDDDKKVYFIGEAYEATDIKEYDGSTLLIEAAYGSFKITPRSYSTDIYFQDFNEHQTQIRSNKDELCEIILDNLKTIYKDTTSKTLYEFVYNNRDAINKNINNIEINNEER